MSKLRITFCCALASLIAGEAASAQSLRPPQKDILLRAAQTGQVERFEELAIFLEQNATDGDAEVVIELKGGDVGIQHLWIIDPNSRVLNRFKARNGSLGGREFRIESPEPDLETVLAAFPAGEYLFIGKTFTDQWLVGIDELSHELPPEANITFPPDGSVVPPGPLQITWDAVVGTDRYLVGVDNEDTDAAFGVEISANVTTVSAPPEFIVAGTAFKAEVGTFNEHGNLTIVEVEFLTESP